MLDGGLALDGAPMLDVFMEEVLGGLEAPIPDLAGVDDVVVVLEDLAVDGRHADGLETVRLRDEIRLDAPERAFALPCREASRLQREEGIGHHDVELRGRRLGADDRHPYRHRLEHRPRIHRIDIVDLDVVDDAPLVGRIQVGPASAVSEPPEFVEGAHVGEVPAPALLRLLPVAVRIHPPEEVHRIAGHRYAAHVPDVEVGHRDGEDPGVALDALEVLLSVPVSRRPPLLDVEVGFSRYPVDPRDGLEAESGELLQRVAEVDDMVAVLDADAHPLTFIGDQAGELPVVAGIMRDVPPSMRQKPAHIVAHVVLQVVEPDGRGPEERDPLMEGGEVPSVDLPLRIEDVAEAPEIDADLAVLDVVDFGRRLEIGGKDRLPDLPHFLAFPFLFGFLVFPGELLSAHSRRLARSVSVCSE